MLPPCDLRYKSETGTTTTSGGAGCVRVRRADRGRRSVAEISCDWIEERDPGQDPRHLGTLEPVWNLLDLTREGRPAEWDEQLRY